LRDLKQRGMRADTVVVWTTEFGRTPGVDGTAGRGHDSATNFHLLGLDHERLTFRHGGRDDRLTDVFGNVVHAIFA